MKASVTEHAHRKLRRLLGYVSGQDTALLAEAFLKQSPTVTGDIVAGYRNASPMNADTCGDWLVFTTTGVVGRVDGGVQYIPYRDIVSVIWEDKGESESDWVRLSLRSSATIVLSVKGRDSERETHDKFSVMMFLDSVTGPKAD